LDYTLKIIDKIPKKVHKKFEIPLKRIYVCIKYIILIDYFKFNIL